MFVRDLALVVVATCLGAGPAFGNPHPVTLGQVPAAVDSVEVGIAQEVLDIDVDPGRARVRARIELHNRGPAVNLPVAFPCEVDRGGGVVGLDCRVRPEVTVAGRPTRVRRVRTNAGTEWAFRIPLPAGARAWVVVRYHSQFEPDHEPPLHGVFALVYRLTTGAAWAGTIGDLQAQVTLPAEALPIADIAPAGYAREDRRIAWHMTDYEPSEDLVVGFHFPPRVTYALDRLAHARGAEHERALEGLREAIDRTEGDAESYVAGTESMAQHYGFPVAPLDRVQRTLAETARRLRESLLSL